MYRPILSLFLTCSLAFLIGCGQEPTKTPATGQSSTQKLEAGNSAVLRISENEMDVIPDAKYLVWHLKEKLPAMNDLRSTTEILLKSKELDRFSINEVDSYLDSYDREDEPFSFSVQVSLPQPLIEKSEGLVRISFPVQAIESHLNLLIRSLSDRAKDVRRVTLRILLTDRSQPGNPIRIIVHGILLEASD